MDTYWNYSFRSCIVQIVFDDKSVLSVTRTSFFNSVVKSINLVFLNISDCGRVINRRPRHQVDG